MERLEQRGVRTWMTPDPDETEEQRQEREGFLARMLEAQRPKTTAVDVAEHIERKLDALRAHVTQIRTTDFFLAMTPDEWREFAPTEGFTLAELQLAVTIS